MRSKGYNSCTSWVAAFACSVIGFLLPIPMRIAGLLFIILIDHYETDRLHATIPIIVFGMLRSITGPFTGYLGQVFGLRTITLLGSILATVGVGACFFAENINTVVIYLGFIYGIGFGLGSTLVPTILRQHFNKDFNFVNGTYLTGSCLGAVIIPQVVEFLIKEYGYSGMFLLLSGILLNSVPFAILLKDPKNEEYHLKVEKQNNLSKITSDSLRNSHNIQTVATVSDNLKQLEAGRKACAGIIDNKFRESLQVSLRSDKKKGITNPSFTVETINTKQQVLCLNFTTIHQESDVTKSQNNDLNVCKTEGIKLNHFNTNTTLIHKLKSEMGDKPKEQVLNNKPKIGEENCQLVTSEAACAEKTSNKNSRRELFLLFLDPTFLVQMTLQSLHAFITTLIWTILIDFARDKGISPTKSLYFLMYLPLAEMVGNLSLTWISDRGHMTRANYCVVCLLILSADSVYMVYAGNYVSLMIAVLLFGCVSGSLGATFPGMIHEFIEEHQQAMALASRFVLYAFLCLCKTPIIGHFRGNLGSYNGVFYIIAACCLFCVILVIVTPILATFRHNKKYENKL